MEVVWSLAILMCLVKLYLINALGFSFLRNLHHGILGQIFGSKYFWARQRPLKVVSLIIIKSICLLISRCRNLILILFINYNSAHSEFTFSDYTFVCFRCRNLILFTPMRALSEVASAGFGKHQCSNPGP